MIELPRSSEIRKICLSHAAVAKPSSGMASWAQIESVLASYIASVVYAEAEACIRRLVSERIASGTHDQRVQSFCKVAANKLVRSIKISELTGTLNHFDPECKQHFNRTVTAKQRTDWDSLLDTRHNLAHENPESPRQLTLSDVENYCQSISEVLAIFDQALRA